MNGQNLHSLFQLRPVLAFCVGPVDQSGLPSIHTLEWQFLDCKEKKLKKHTSQSNSPFIYQADDQPKIAKLSQWKHGKYIVIAGKNTTCEKYTWAVFLTVCLVKHYMCPYTWAVILTVCLVKHYVSIHMGSRINGLPQASKFIPFSPSQAKVNFGQPPPEGRFRFLSNFTREKVP